MKRLYGFLSLLLMLMVTACAANGGGVTTTGGGARPASGYEIYEHNGGVARPNNAVDVYIAYAPETEEYMPEIIRLFNQSYADGVHPVTKQPLTESDARYYMWGTQPENGGSSGSLARGVVNAVIAPNNADIYKPTILQPSVSTWLGYINYNAGRPIFDLSQIQPTAISPVVIGIWEERLAELERRTGKDRTELGWADLLDVLETGWEDGNRRAVYYGHADPIISSTALSTFIMEYYACARREGITERRISLATVNTTSVQDCVREIESLVKHYSDRTEDFLEYVGQGPDYLDMLALEETDLICINLGATQGDQQCLRPQGGQRLVAIYPSEGTFWHEHPFATVQWDVAQGGWTTQAQRDGAAVFTEFVISEEIQQIILQNGFRPANPNVPVGYPFVEENGVLPAGPSQILDLPDYEVIIAMQNSWSLVKKQTDIMLLIDVSGSMNDEGRLEQAKEAARQFIAQMEPTNRLGLAVFNETVTVRVPLGNAETTSFQVTAQIDTLRADGGTAMYAGLVETIAALEAEDVTTNRIRAIVLLSDGADTSDGSVTLNEVVQAIQASRSTLNPILVVPVAYGSNADVTALNNIARASATRVQSGDPNNIGEVLEVIASFF
ncbi:MAG: vWA domain-containing protein [Phototrophicaceae bacterium]|jgi:Ca-activated chloride channel family protein